ncbi:hypothetical protein U9M48_018349 [Paspalum notatum var. saurae]|uniref:Aminotransferase-like plant mobile domain-containing protein n=1 Tax=Paspalum notatum var. saurae TaxID=547442 RepID=A0AAQ3WQ29_PASNO
MDAPQGYVTPELLDAATDRKHRSYFSAVLGSSLGQFRARVPMESMALDPRWVPRLRASGLLPLARLVEGKRPRFSYDFSLLASMVDRWRPETHTFHLTVGEMAPILQDVSYLLGLPLRGDAMGPTDYGPGWRDDLLNRFGRVQRSPTSQAYKEFAPTHTGGPPKWWILQFKADDIRAGATEYEVARHLEAYVLWLMGWVMFCSSAGSFVAKGLLPFARYVADAPLDAIPQFSWGSAVLAATYRGLCTACFKSSGAEPIFGGCPLLLQLWAHERFQIGRPAVVHSAYEGYIVDDVDGPTMGSLWCDQRFAYAHVQTRKSYPDFVGQYDVLRDDDVRWQPYSVEAVEARAPEGLSALCVRDAEYWRTRRPLVFDIYVEEHAVHRVLRQLGLFQEIVVPRSLLPPHVHRLIQLTQLEFTCSFTRQGQTVGQLWAPRLEEFVTKWATALDDVVIEGRPHDDAVWGHYLRWYLPRTRLRVTSTPQELPRRTPGVTDSYPTQRDQGALLAHDVVRQIHAEAVSYSRSSLTMAPQQHKAAYDKIAELCRRVTRSLSCRDDDVGLPPQQPVFHAPAPTPPPPRSIPLYGQTTPMTYPPSGTQYGTHAGSSSRPPLYYQDTFGAGTSSRPPPYYQDALGYEAGTTPDDSYGAGHAPPSPAGAAEEMAQSLFASPTHDELGYSQLQDAPPRATQQSQELPAQDTAPPRRTRVPPDPFSHGSRHTWAAQRAAAQWIDTRSAPAWPRRIPQEAETKGRYMVRMDEAREAERQARLERERQLRQQQICLDGKDKQLNRRRDDLVAREIELKRREDELKRRQDLLRAAEQRGATNHGGSSSKGDRKGKNIRFTQQHQPSVQNTNGSTTWERSWPWEEGKPTYPLRLGRRLWASRDYYDMGNCRFAKWVDPPNHQHIDDYISYLKDRIHDLECEVKSLEEDAKKKTPLVVSLEDDPLCPDPFCKCPYHPRSDWPPKSPPSGGHGFYEEGGSSHFSSANYA